MGTELVADISEEVMTMVMTVQFVELRSASVAPQDFDAAYKRWEIASAVIGTKLQAYIPKRDVGRRWTSLLDEKSDFIDEVMRSKGMKI